MRLSKVGTGQPGISRRPVATAVTLGVAAAVIMLVGALSQSTTAQVPAGTPATVVRTNGKPDFSGIWQANNTANWDLQTHAARPMVAQPGFTPNTVVCRRAGRWRSERWAGSPAGLGVVEGEEIPYQPWAAARKAENLAKWLDRDPELKCFQPGVPRAMYMPYPYQIIQSNEKVNFVLRVRQRGAHHPPEQDGALPEHGMDGLLRRPVARRYTDSGDRRSFSDGTWFDRAGNFHSDALKVVERFTPMGRDAFRYEATMEDPQVFTRPWKIEHADLPPSRAERAAARLPLRRRWSRS